MNQSRLTKNFFNYITEIMTTTKWAEETRKEMVEVGSDPTGSCNKEVFQNKYIWNKLKM